ncbi:MAG: hypothetical protein KAJ62_05145 [Desulfobacteraceae bacterium]|nr:hypothetical protein [Desulfobacteraceae bacterium]
MPKQSCFIIMPITTPDSYVGQYEGDTEHFMHILKHLFLPAIDLAGLDPIEPNMKGSDVIQSEIIKNLETADLVFCDMSILNPNVFFELGIRTALNKPVAMVRDDVIPKIPFDISPIYCHPYESGALRPWALNIEIESLSKHLEDCLKNSDKNTLWEQFGMSQQAKPPEGATGTEAQLSYLITQIDGLRKSTHRLDRGDNLSELAISNIINTLIDMHHMLGNELGPEFAGDFNSLRRPLKELCLKIDRVDLFEKYMRKTAALKPFDL